MKSSSKTSPSGRCQHASNKRLPGAFPTRSIRMPAYRMQRQLAQSPHVIEVVADQASWNVGGGIRLSNCLCAAWGSWSLRTRRSGRHMSAGDLRANADGVTVRVGRRTVDTRLVTECMAAGFCFQRVRVLALQRRRRLRECIYRGSAAPARSGAVKVESRDRYVTPLVDPMAPLGTPDDLRDPIKTALARYQARPGRVTDPPPLKKARPNLARIRPCFGTRLRARSTPNGLNDDVGEGRLAWPGATSRERAFGDAGVLLLAGLFAGTLALRPQLAGVGPLLPENPG